MNAIELTRASGLFDERQAGQIEALMGSLTPEQAIWLSGYLAGIAGGGAGVPAPPAADGGEEAPSVTVLYGTETGNAEGVARQFVEAATAKGIRTNPVDMADYRTKNLRKETHLVVVSATHGEGDPPDPAIGFFEFLAGRKAPSLDQVRYAVLSLGDSSYVEFCKAGKDLDERLEELGGERILDRVDCDVDYEDDSADWIEKLAGVLEEELARAPAATPSETAPAPSAGLARLFGNGGPSAAPSRPTYSRKSPYEAEILDAVVLSGRYSDKETVHLELSVEEDALPFEPGDSLGIVPENEEGVVESVLDVLGFSPSDRVTVGKSERELAHALRHDLELTRLTPAFLSAYAECAEAKQLRSLLETDRREKLTEFMACNQVPDILHAFPAPGIEAQTFVDMLRRLQPRLYSIASSRKWMPDQVDLTVSVTRFTRDRKPRNGVASTLLAERRAPGESVEVYVDHNKAFKLPQDPDAPIIMIGAGTGVAPYRAFLQEREETGAKGRNWLVFGERRFREDFLYQTEWQRFLKDGLLTHMDVAFSRDQERKVYVQHRVREQGRRVWEWLEEGAYVYVCGDADGMAPAVHETLVDVIREEGDFSPDDAGEYLRRLQHDRRYQRDVY